MALSSIPWIGGVFAAGMTYKMREGDIARDNLIEQWLQEHHDKLLLLRQTLEDMATRLEGLTTFAALTLPSVELYSGSSVSLTATIMSLPSRIPPGTSPR